MGTIQNLLKNNYILKLCEIIVIMKPLQIFEITDTHIFPHSIHILSL